MTKPLTIAVPKGRILKDLIPLVQRAGLDSTPLQESDRRLVRPTADGAFRYVFLKPDDVPTYVEYGAADLGVSGRDTLLERRHDLYTPLDLGIGRCRLVVAGPEGTPIPDLPRVATKYPRIAGDHFASKGVVAEIIPVHGSVELAPLVGLSHLIVDIVETGATLRENRLEVLETVTEVSTLLIANRASYKLRSDAVRPLVERLRAATAGAGR
ncbi:ATP phosphoribosyltransferase [Sorangium cellulosum]|uniref:ATP phosphoribosyltransferase n=4 Tax=Sorangium cellulosum TaxID=56 RepID=A0A150TUL7_SORCE|nr:ATP phosphoribosyltransferase [Sorangium cellulosum]AGP42231.1 ATP phosphoribosyltransferase [Sorangium cellulosum So0157-2]KYG08403.1 ATP phosphoribosyltransferase [Sorangium cellulosum]